MTDPLPRLGLVLGVEHLAQGGGDQAALIAAAVVEHVPDEVHRAPLPRAGEHPGDRGLQPFVVIGDREADAGQPALFEPAQELGPEGAGLDLADVEPDDLSDPRLVHGVGDHQRLGHHPAVVSDLDVIG